ncbi:hypothetical protein ACIOJE_40820, partial [Kitasatospora sp. NPDC087861]|uniref:hypothetical protein n=1 Tax=Kitasatospora sp. NPDC087861 TaxID=3364070 RepID=UPI0037F14B20
AALRVPHRTTATGPEPSLSGERPDFTHSSSVAEAEAVWERFVIARATVAEVLAEPCGGKAVPPVVVAGGRPARVAAAVPGSVVPQWREGLDAGVLAPDYQRLMGALAGGDGSCGEAMDVRQLAAALGLEPVPAKVEGVRSKVKRLAARGWLAEERPGMFSVVAGRGVGS